MSKWCGLLLVFDPGREKCGYAVFQVASGVQIGPCQCGIVTVADAIEISRELIRGAPSSSGDRPLPEGGSSGDALRILVGNGTGGRDLTAAIRSLGGEVTIVAEAFTTRRARQRYFVENPPRGWRRLVPRTLLTPPRPVDDLAAMIMGEDWLAAGMITSQPWQPRKKDEGSR